MASVFQLVNGRGPLIRQSSIAGRCHVHSCSDGGALRRVTQRSPGDRVRICTETLYGHRQLYHYVDVVVSTAGSSHGRDGNLYASPHRTLWLGLHTFAMMRGEVPSTLLCNPRTLLIHPDVVLL